MVLTFLRLDWLGRDRIVDYSRAIALLYVPGLVFLMLVALDVVVIPSDHTGTDFVSFWSAARLILAGDNPYDLSALFAMQDGSRYAFLYPPPFLFPILPFGLLPYGISLILWSALGVGLVVVLARRLSPSIWPVLAFPPLLVNAAHGQNGALTAALFFAAALNIAKRPFLAGLFLGCFVIKPHLALLFPVAFLFGKRWLVIAGGVVSAGLLLAASYFAFGADVWTEFFSKGAEARELLEQNVLLHPKLVSAFGIVRTPGGALWLAYVLQGVAACVAAGAVAIAWKRGDTGFGMSVLATAATLATPFIYSYDLVLLLLPIAWLARDGMTRGFRPWVKTAMVLAFWIPLVDRIVGAYVGINPAFLANAALLAALFYQGYWDRPGGSTGHGSPATKPARNGGEGSEIHA